MNKPKTHWLSGPYLVVCVVVCVVVCLTVPARADEIPKPVAEFTQHFCSACHGEETQEGDFRIDKLSWQFDESESRKQWQLVRRYIASGDMPPKEADTHPDRAQRLAVLKSFDAALRQGGQAGRVGGTPVRRLNRVEYLNTVRDLFGIRMINLPPSFPEDSTSAEFDTMSAGLLLSPAVMEAYHDVATDIANRFVPLSNSPSYSSSLTVDTIGGDASRRWFGPKKSYLKFTGFNQSGWVGALWDSLFIAPASGVYRVKLLANAESEAGADGRPLRLSFYAFDPTEEQLVKRYRLERAALVAEVDVPPGEQAWIECDVPVEAGETFHVYCANRLPDEAYEKGDLNRAEISKALKKLKQRSEPTVQLRALKVAGPVNVPPRVNAFFGTWPPKLDRGELESKLVPLAERAFRRPLEDAEAEKLIRSVLQHGEQTKQPEFAWHYAVRRILCSPQFLYREAENPGSSASVLPATGKALSEFALATRLAYFLWSTMPDDELLRVAADGELSDPATMAGQTKRMLQDPRARQFVKHFTGQWLGNRNVAAINVCDNRYEWDDNVRYGFIRSTEMFFEEVLRENLPISTFIDSDFTYANSAMRAVWGIKSGRDKTLSAVAARQRQSLVWPEPDRIDLTNLPSDAPQHVRDRGGILGLPGVLTVTGDGVESSPILRGVWVLANLFGRHPPPPPKDVPALDIDTSQATTVREILAAHQKNQSCAKCHRDIDPFGLALENYDAVGGWRETYQGDKSPIDATATLPNGQPIDGAKSIKQMLLAEPEIFTRCLLTKLLEYGAGRELSVGDIRIVDELVSSTPEEGYRLQDLIIAATTSDVFLSK